MGNMLLGLSCAVLLAATEGVAPAALPPNAHPWGSFLPNSWRIVQTDTISNIEGRMVRSAKTVKTTLQAVDRNSVTLTEAETLNLNGKIVVKTPQLIKHDFFQEPIQENVIIRQGEPGKVQMINKKTIVPCTVRIYEQQTAGGHLTTTIWYSSQVYPYVLRVEKILRDSPDGENARGRIIRQSVMLVQETSALRLLRGVRNNRTYSVQTEEKAGGITTITNARCSWDVPGGLLESTTQQFDEQNREISRSVSKMTNYHLFELVPRPSQRFRPMIQVEVLN